MNGHRADTIHACFREQAALRPHEPALRHGDRVWTYAELDLASDAVAAHLRSFGVGRGHVVPTLMERSFELVAVLLGVLKTGAAYAALDTSWPAGRLHDLIGQLNAPVLVGTAVKGVSGPVWDPWIAPAAPNPPQPDEAVSSDPCCVFFTSGTTGTSRGALVPHAGTVLLFRDCRFAELGPGSAMLQAAPLPWDGMTLELWSMLMTGGTSLLLAGEPPVTARDVRVSVGAGATLLWLTCTMFNLFVDEDLDCFRGLGHVLVGGERLSQPHVARFLDHHPGVRLTNGYGPAEVTVFVTTHEISSPDTEDPDGVPLGLAVPDTELLVMDDGEVCGDDVVGELCVAGPRLCLGYLGHPRHPAFRDVAVGGRRRLVYATGDLVVSRGGRLSFVARKDRQLKIRGTRVEPLELEGTISARPGIIACRVIPIIDEEGRATALAAFYTGSSSSELQQRVWEHLRQTLPQHLHPSALVPVESFPVTANGKLDEHRLHELLATHMVMTATPTRLPDSTARQEERSAVAEQVIEEIGRLLSLPSPPLDAGFLALGGTSLDLARLAMRLERRLGVVLSVADLARAPDIWSVIALVEEADGQGNAVVVDDDPEAGQEVEVALDPVRTAFLLQDRGLSGDTSALCLMLWEVTGSLDLDSLLCALSDVRDRHQALGSTYVLDRHPYARPPAPGPRSRVSLEDLGEAADFAEGRGAVLRSLTTARLRLSDGEVLKAAVAKIQDLERHAFGIVVHHVAFDGWSEAVLAGDLSFAYAARRRGRAPAWEVPVASLAKTASQRSRRRSDEYGRDALDYWRDHLRDTVPFTPHQASPNACPATCEVDAHVVVEETVPNALRAWRALAVRERVSLFSVLLSTYATVLAPELVDSRIALGVPVSTRAGHHEENVVMCAIATLCLRLDLCVEDDPVQGVRLSQQEFARAQEHGSIAFPDLVRELRPRRSSRNPIYQTMFALQDNAPPDLSLPGCTTRFERPQAPHAAAELLVEITPTAQEGMRVTGSYQCHRVSRGTVERVVATVTRRWEQGPARTN